MENAEPFPLFETKRAKWRLLFKLYVALMVMGICLICYYRATHEPVNTGRYAWIGLFMAELWFTLYWLITQLVRWNPVTHHTFKQRLSQRYEKVLPGVDIFVCTADTLIEPPIMVINTVLSAMAYDYPPEKLHIYVSDDGGSELMFYALLQASRFSKYWLPFCKKYKIEPRSPAAYIATLPHKSSPIANECISLIKDKYEEMTKRIENTMRLGKLTQELRNEHKGFQEWDAGSNKHDHQAIVQILIDQRDFEAVDTEGKTLPSLIYMAREKRPKWHHNFKAGAMNALIRVSSQISNSQIILNVDCDMYSNNSESIRDAMCFFMDQSNIAFVQFPQNFDNLTRNDVYSNSLRVINEVEIGGMDSHGGCLYIGSGCFHRRDALCGISYSNDTVLDWEKESRKQIIRAAEAIHVLENKCKLHASCSYEHNTQWGKELGVKYGCPVEDVITGLAIKCRGWRSVHLNPEREGFLGLAPTTLLQTLVQQKRWAEGGFQIFLSKYCPLASLSFQSYQATGSYLLHMYLSENMHTAWGNFTAVGERLKVGGTTNECGSTED
ncbi:cellulose synthase-like protein E6 [Tanacetum coccineum]